MAFSDEEIAYLRSQPIARLATVNADGQPDVVPVAFAQAVTCGDLTLWRGLK